MMEGKRDGKFLEKKLTMMNPYSEQRWEGKDRDVGGVFRLLSRVMPPLAVYLAQQRVLGADKLIEVL